MVDDDKKPSSSGQHALHLMQAVEDAPHPIDVLPAPKAPSVPSVATIDPEKLLGAWSSSTAVLKQLVTVIAATEADNKKTRDDNARTRKVVLSAVFAGCTLLVVLAANLYFVVRFHTQRTMEVAEAARAITASTAKDVAATLRVMRSVSRALGAKVEADAALTPDAEANAQAAAVEAQVVAAQAEKSVTDDPATKQKATVELEQLKVKAKRLQVHVQVDTDAAPAASGGKP